MKKKVLIIVLCGIIIAMTVLFSNTMGKELIMQNKLVLKIQINKEKYKLGDNFEVTYILQNVSDKPIIILPWRFEYATNILTIYDKKEQKNVEKLRLLIYELKFIPQREDFVVILPRNVYTKTFGGIIKKENMSKFDQNSSSKNLGKLSLVIDFNDSAFLLEENNREYIISAIYKTDPNAIKKGKELYGLTDVWKDMIKSNEIEFVVEN